MRHFGIKHIPFFDQNLKNSSFSRKRYTLIYNNVDNLAYCPIAKVASSTWCGHFLRMGETVMILILNDIFTSLISANISEAEFKKKSQFLQGAAPKYWPAPKEGMICKYSFKQNIS